MLTNDSAEDLVWKNINPDDLWILDKLILSRKLGYTSGPVGLDVPKPGYYIVRPCVNMLGLGLGTQKVWIEQDTTHLPLGHFWCEFFQGRHISVDYYQKSQVLAVEGFKNQNTFVRWEQWIKVIDCFEFPNILNNLKENYKYINCEFIGDKLIEVHLRHNEDFEDNMTHFIPVWEGESTAPPEGYSYRLYPDVHGRIGAFVK
jgi:hypothetical protein